MQSTGLRSSSGRGRSQVGYGTPIFGWWDRGFGSFLDLRQSILIKGTVRAVLLLRFCQFDS
jgi:hypothetical protein